MRKFLAPTAALFVLAAVGALTMSIDWSSFTDALTGVIPDVVALAAGVVAATLSIALITKGVRYVTHLATSFMR
jgi:membrane protein YqaA with SNARE-associated domain